MVVEDIRKLLPLDPWLPILEDQMVSVVGLEEVLMAVVVEVDSAEGLIVDMVDEVELDLVVEVVEVKTTLVPLLQMLRLVQEDEVGSQVDEVAFLVVLLIEVLLLVGMSQDDLLTKIETEDTEVVTVVMATDHHVLAVAATWSLFARVMEAIVTAMVAVIAAVMEVIDHEKMNPERDLTKAMARTHEN